MDVDTRLTNLANKFRETLEDYLVSKTDRTFWQQNNKFRYRNSREIDDLLIDLFESIEVNCDDSIVLLKQCIWVGMNVPWPVDPDAHIQRVIDNVMEVFDTIVYGNLRYEILELNHEAHSKL